MQLSLVENAGLFEFLLDSTYLIFRLRERALAVIGYALVFIALGFRGEQLFIERLCFLGNRLEFGTIFGDSHLVLVQH